MDYHRASDIRKQGLMSLMTERLSSGQGTSSSIKSAISDTTKATFTGIKQKFDPLNIAKVVTGGSKFGPAMVGALTGRSKEDIGFFTGKKRESLRGLKSTSNQGSESMVDVLGLIYRGMLRLENDRKLELEEKQNKQQEIESEENRRNQALIEALTSRKKKPTKSGTKKLETTNKKVEEEKKKTPKIKESKVEKPTIPSKEVPKPTAAPAKPTAPTVSKPPTVATPKPTAPAAPTAPPVTAPTAGRVTTGAIVGGAAVAGTAALVGKEALASNIAKYESGKAGYNAYNKGTVGNKMIPSDKPIDFSKMTISEFLRRGGLKQGDPDRLFAVGKYQIIPPTMKDLIKQLKIDPNTTYLDAATQDLLFTNGLVGQRRKKVDAYVKGQSDDRNGAILQLAQEFASVGIPYDMKVGDKQLKKGDSYYSGQGGNKAHNSPEQVGAALDADRLKNMQGNKSTEIPAVATGNKINSESVENMGLKKSSNQTPQVQKSVNTTNVNSRTLASNTPEREDDTNPMIKKAQSR